MTDDSKISLINSLLKLPTGQKVTALIWLLAFGGVGIGIGYWKSDIENKAQITTLEDRLEYGPLPSKQGEEIFHDVPTFKSAEMDQRSLKEVENDWTKLDNNPNKRTPNISGGYRNADDELWGELHHKQVKWDLQIVDISETFLEQNRIISVESVMFVGRVDNAHAPVAEAIFCRFDAASSKAKKVRSLNIDDVIRVRGVITGNKQLDRCEVEEFIFTKSP